MKTNATIRFAAMVSVALLSAAAAADPVMPDGFRMTFSDETGKTWRQTGVFPVSPSNALETLRETFRKQGYSERYDIPGGSNERHLLLWTRKDEDVILMVWKTQDNTTGCSWGISAPPPSADSSSEVSEADSRNKAKTPNEQTTNEAINESTNENTSHEDKRSSNLPPPETVEPTVSSPGTNSQEAASADHSGPAGVPADVR